MFHVIQTQHKAFNANFHTGKLICEDKEFNWVYDCGSKLLAKDYLKTVDKIDLIFISHFDSDHIGGIPTLLASTQAQHARIIVPYFSDEDILILFYKNNYDVWCKSKREKKTLERFVSDVIDARETSRESEINLFEERSEQRIQVVPVGQDFSLRLQFKANEVFWLFKTHVFEEQKLKDKLQTSLEGVFPIRQLRKNFKQFAKDFREKYKQEISQIKSILEKESRNVMTMSMISAPLNRRSQCFNCEHQAVWLHTGDAYLSDNDIYNQFYNFLEPNRDEINYCVLPHHGSEKSATTRLFGDLRQNCHYIITPHSNVTLSCSSANRLFCVANRNFQTIFMTYWPFCFKSYLLCCSIVMESQSVAGTCSDGQKCSSKCKK